jgi:hypothetical protein
MMVHICNLNTQKAEAGESQVWGQPELQNKTLSQKNNNKKKKIKTQSFCLKVKFVIPGWNNESF